MGTSRVFNCVGVLGEENEVLGGENEDLSGGKKLGVGVRRSRNSDGSLRRG